MKIKDADILKMQKVTPADAADYLGLSVTTVREGLVSGVFPFGVAIKADGAKNYNFDIRPLALVEYNRHGVAGERLMDKVLQKINHMEELIYDRHRF